MACICCKEMKFDLASRAEHKGANRLTASSLAQGHVHAQNGRDQKSLQIGAWLMLCNSRHAQAYENTGTLRSKQHTVSIYAYRPGAFLASGGVACPTCACCVCVGLGRSWQKFFCVRADCYTVRRSRARNVCNVLRVTPGLRFFHHCRKPGTNHRDLQQLTTTLSILTILRRRV